MRFLSAEGTRLRSWNSLFWTCQRRKLCERVEIDSYAVEAQRESRLAQRCRASYSFLPPAARMASTWAYAIFARLSEYVYVQGDSINLSDSTRVRHGAFIKNARNTLKVFPLHRARFTWETGEQCLGDLQLQIRGKDSARSF